MNTAIDIQNDFLKNRTLANLSIEEFIDYYKKNEQIIEQELLNHGAIKFKNIRIDSMNDFQKITSGISEKFGGYVDGNSPRTKLSGTVYTSTEYDKSQKITMHNELSYSAIWPGKLFLSCLIPAQMGGETLLADSRQILKEMPEAIVSEIRDKGIHYIRNLHGGMGMGPSWQHTFETENREELEKHCENLGIDYEWKDDGGIRLIQYSKGIIKHTKTGEEVWFNQIDQFHPSHLGDDLYETIQAIYEDPREFPMYVQFADGTSISESVVKQITEIIDRLTVAPVWDKHELLMVDNVLACHGRNPYEGERRVVVSMSK